MTSLEIDVSGFDDIDGNVVLITGGASGIGRAAAEIFHDYGAKVMIGDRNQKLGAEAASEIGKNCTFQQCDVTSWLSLHLLFDAAFDRYGRIDYVLANAGIAEIEDIFSDILDQDTGKLLEPLYRVLEVDLKGVLATVKLAKHFFEKGQVQGGIVITSSTAGVVGDTYIPVYTAAKHGVVGLMRSLSGRQGPFAAQKIRVNCVSPFMTESGFLTNELIQVLETNQVPINKASTVAKAIMYLAITPGITGQNIYVADNAFTELEGPIRKLRPQWLGNRAAELLENPMESEAMTAGHEQIKSAKAPQEPISNEK